MIENKVKSVREAWEEVQKLIPRYKKDKESSAIAGYPVYRDYTDYDNYICDLGNRLEVNLYNNNFTLNIWITSDPNLSVVDETEYNNFYIEIISETGLVRKYDSYLKFREDFRFFWSKDECIKVEKDFEYIMQTMNKLKGSSRFTCTKNGIEIVFIYKSPSD